MNDAASEDMFAFMKCISGHLLCPSTEDIVCLLFLSGIVFVITLSQFQFEL